MLEGEIVSLLDDFHRRLSFLEARKPNPIRPPVGDRGNSAPSVDRIVRGRKHVANHSINRLHDLQSYELANSSRRDRWSGKQSFRKFSDFLNGLLSNEIINERGKMKIRNFMSSVPEST